MHEFVILSLLKEVIYAIVLVDWLIDYDEDWQ